MEEVVLHAADDAAKCRDVAAEHAIEVHAPQFVRDARGRAQDLEEQPVIARVLAELLVDEPQALGNEPDGAGAHAAKPRVLLQNDEELQERRRVTRENVLGYRLDAIVALLEVAREGQRRRVAIRKHLLADLLQQQFVEPAHQHRRAVVALHELFDRERIGRILVAEHPREPDLVVEEQAIFAAAAQEVQRKRTRQPGLG
jgi:hypothetical protein